MKNIYLQLLDHQSDSNHLVLATVTRTKGSTPQKPGSSALFNKNGLGDRYPRGKFLRRGGF